MAQEAQLVKRPPLPDSLDSSGLQLVGPVPELQQARSYEPICSASECKQPRPPRFLREHTFLKRKPATLTCPNCLRAVETIVERHCTLVTHLAALMMLPCCLCPLAYCSNMLRDSIHRCPSCGVLLGSKFASATEAFVICLTEREPEMSHYASETHFL